MPKPIFDLLSRRHCFIWKSKAFQVGQTNLPKAAQPEDTFADLISLAENCRTALVGFDSSHTQPRVESAAWQPGAQQDPLMALSDEYQNVVLGFERAARPASVSQPRLTRELTEVLPDNGADLAVLINHAPGINTVLGALDSFNAEALFAAPAQAEILGLLAPALVNRRKRGLAGLNQREHHTISIDSHFLLAGGTSMPEAI